MRSLSHLDGENVNRFGGGSAWFTLAAVTDPDHAIWWLYLLRSSAGRSYVGISNDLDRRIAQHNGELPGGAKATRAGRPWQIVRRWGPFAHDRAARLEFELKQRRGPRRLDWEPERD